MRLRIEYRHFQFTLLRRFHKTVKLVTIITNSAPRVLDHRADVPEEGDMWITATAAPTTPRRPAPSRPAPGR
jgi:hypothetical protein